MTVSGAYADVESSHVMLHTTVTLTPFLSDTPPLRIEPQNPTQNQKTPQKHPKNKESRDKCRGFRESALAMSYSPTQKIMQYHRRRRA